MDAENKVHAPASAFDLLSAPTLLALLVAFVTWLVLPFCRESEEQKNRTTGRAERDLSLFTQRKVVADTADAEADGDSGSNSAVEDAHGAGTSAASAPGTGEVRVGAGKRRQGKAKAVAPRRDANGALDDCSPDPGPYFSQLDDGVWCAILSFLDPQALHRFETAGPGIRHARGVFDESIFETAWRVCYAQPYHDANLSLAALPKTLRVDHESQQVVEAGSRSDGQATFRDSNTRRLFWKKRCLQRDAALKNNEGRLQHFIAWLVEARKTDLQHARAGATAGSVDAYFTHETNFPLHVASRVPEVSGPRPQQEDLMTFFKKGTVSLGTSYTRPILDDTGFAVAIEDVLISAAVVFGLAFRGSAASSNPFVVCGVRTRRRGQDGVVERVKYDAWAIPLVLGQMAKTWERLAEQVLADPSRVSQLLFDAGLLYSVEEDVLGTGRFVVKDMFPARLQECLRATGLVKMGGGITSRGTSLTLTTAKDKEVNRLALKFFLHFIHHDLEELNIAEKLEIPEPPGS